MRFKREEFALCPPVKGQASIVHKPVCGELRRMPSIQDRRDNVGCEEGEPKETRNIGTADPLLCRDLFER